MTKEEYTAQLADIENHIRSLSNKIKDLNKEYLSANSPIPNGTKVTILSSSWHNQEEKEQTGIVTGYKIHYSGEVRPVLSQIKKDNTASSRELHIWGKVISITPVN